MRVTTAAARTIVKAARRTSRPCQIGDGFGRRAAGRSSLSRFQPIVTAIPFPSAIGASPLPSLNVMLTCANPPAPLALEVGEGEADDDDGRQG